MLSPTDTLPPPQQQPHELLQQQHLHMHVSQLHAHMNVNRTKHLHAFGGSGSHRQHPQQQQHQHQASPTAAATGSSQYSAAAPSHVADQIDNPMCRIARSSTATPASLHNAIAGGMYYDSSSSDLHHAPRITAGPVAAAAAMASGYRGNGGDSSSIISSSYGGLSNFDGGSSASPTGEPAADIDCGGDLLAPAVVAPGSATTIAAAGVTESQPPQKLRFSLQTSPSNDSSCSSPSKGGSYSLAASLSRSRRSSLDSSGSAVALRLHQQQQPLPTQIHLLLQHRLLQQQQQQQPEHVQSQDPQQTRLPAHDLQLMQQGHQQQQQQRTMGASSGWFPGVASATAFLAEASSSRTSPAKSTLGSPDNHLAMSAGPSGLGGASAAAAAGALPASAAAANLTARAWMSTKLRARQQGSGSGSSSPVAAAAAGSSIQSNSPLDHTSRGLLKPLGRSGGGGGGASAVLRAVMRASITASQQHGSSSTPPVQSSTASSPACSFREIASEGGHSCRSSPRVSLDGYEDTNNLVAALTDAATTGSETDSDVDVPADTAQGLAKAETVACAKHRPGSSSAPSSAASLPVSSGPSYPTEEEAQVLPAAVAPAAPCEAEALFETDAVTVDVTQPLAATPTVPFDELAKATEGWAQQHFIRRTRFGMVYKASLASSGKTVAITKLAPGVGGIGHSCDDDAKVALVHALESLSHPNIVSLVGHDLGHGCFVHTHVEGASTLHDFLVAAAEAATSAAAAATAPASAALRQKRAAATKQQSLLRLDWTQRLQIMTEVASALAYLHGQAPPLAHGSLRPDSILIDPNSSSCRLINVGVAALLATARENDEEDEGDVEGRKSSGSSGSSSRGLSSADDIYAFGLIILQILLLEPDVREVHGLIAEFLPEEGGQPSKDAKLATRATDAILDRMRCLKGVASSGKGEVGGWPVELARGVASLGLQCCIQKKLQGFMGM